MNKISNINLGGFPFTIDEDAYQALDKYLKTIHKHFRKSEGYEEITTDIETRLAELFQEKLEGRPIVTLPDVKNVIAIMGTPEDFGAADPFMDEAPKSSSGKFKLKTGKKLFRDPEREAIAGVCSGIAAYFGIQDPLWVRLVFILLTISGFFGLIVYLICLVVFAPLAPLVFWVLNGFLLGREYITLVAIRRIGRDGAKALRKRQRGTIWLAGTLMAIPLTIPLVNLLVPILGAATFTHIYHALDKRS